MASAAGVGHMSTGVGTSHGGGGAACSDSVPNRVEIVRIAAGGDGVGREDSGRVIFVPRTAPGDVVDVQVLSAKSRWAKGRVRERVREGPERRPAPCLHYEECGGCRLQHITPTAQRGARRGLVQDTLRRIGGLDFTVPDVRSAGSEFEYRNRVTFSVQAGDGGVVAGFRKIHEPDTVADVRDCLLAEAPVRSAWESLREAWVTGIWEAPSDPDARLTIRAAVDGKVDLLVRSKDSVRPEAFDSLLEQVPGLLGCHHAGPRGNPEFLGGLETLPDRWQGIEFDLPADVFLQVNRQVSAEMDRWLDERVGDLSGRTVLDLYSGVGARAIRWASLGAQVTACEVSDRTAEACRHAAAGAGVSLGVETERVEDRIGDLLPVDLVVVNPPRAGLSEPVAEAMVSGSAHRLAYVSCDPATLARDLGRLKPAWTLIELQPFDAFPQTAHVETVAWLHRR